MKSNPIVEEHIRRNNTTQNRFGEMAPHRAVVTQLLTDVAPPTGNRSLCVFGAGNGNDLEYSALTKAYREITLIDLDRHALRRLHKRLADDHLTDTATFQILDGVDVTGILDVLTEAMNDHGVLTLSDSVYASLLEKAQTHAMQIEPHSVVCSTCLLTQIIDSVCMTVGPQDPRLMELVLLLRDCHLRLLVESTTPGGSLVLVTDFVSSLTAPELKDATDEQLASLAKRWIAERNFFSGANPFVLQSLLRSDPRFSSLVHDVRLTRPWRWDIGEKQFAVCAIVARRQ